MSEVVAMLWDVLKEVSTILGGAGILVVSLTWLVRSLLTHWINQDFEKYKVVLAAQHTVELEKLRSDLARHAIEHEVRYRRNDQEISKHLNEVYQRLFVFYENVGSIVKIVEFAGEPSRGTKLEAASHANAEFWQYLLQNRLYIPQPLFKKTRDFADRLVNLLNDFTRNRRREERGLDLTDEQYWSKAYDTFHGESASVFTALVDEFQSRIGIFEPDGGSV